VIWPLHRAFSVVLPWGIFGIAATVIGYFGGDGFVSGCLLPQILGCGQEIFCLGVARPWWLCKFLGRCHRRAQRLELFDSVWH